MHRLHLAHHPRPPALPDLRAQSASVTLQPAARLPQQVQARQSRQDHAGLQRPSQRVRHQAPADVSGHDRKGLKANNNTTYNQG